ncbi:hypothetical protein CBS101457_004182 [Exobasidium rhododendri]|nr:hypothetical protein CBS101457_004182 [Exobasidium rhododendri]
MSEETASSASGSWSRPESGYEVGQNGVETPDSSTFSKPIKKLKAKPIKEVLGKVLPQLQRRDQYQFFALPVDTIDVPDYYTIITHPMDFSTMERKLNEGEYKSVDSFKSDFLLITENAQYFNAVDGTSGFIHTEAKKLQEWGLRVINREGAAVMPEIANEPEGRTLSPKKASGKSGKFAIRLKKLTSPHSSATGTPRTATPSRLNQEIKMEEEDDGDGQDDDGADDSDDSSQMASSSRGASVSFDGSGTPGDRASPETVRKYTKRAVGPRAPYTHKKNRPRFSTVAGLLSTSIHANNDDESEGRPSMAPVSSTSGAIAAAIPLVFGPDGSIELAKLTEDERRAVLRSANLDDWPDVLLPFLESIQPLPTDAQLSQQILARPIKDMVDGFSSAVLSQPSSITSSFSYDVDSLPLDQQKTPFAISSGHGFASSTEVDCIPLAWPRHTTSFANGSLGGPSNDNNPTTPIRILKGRDREKEREAAGVGNLDDWSFPRAHMVKLFEPLDLGLYPGLLPSAWINHIRSSKGGPSKSRLPPFHLSTGPTFENALQDELTSLPSRVLLNGKPGVTSGTASQAMEPPRDVCAAFSEGEARNWRQSEEEQLKAGVRASDIVREAVYGGALGEAYTASVLDFVRGAVEGVQCQQDQLTNEFGEEEQAQEHWKNSSKLLPVKMEVNRVVPSYFDDAGEMLNSDGYIGMGLIPLEVRKEAGLSTQNQVIRRSASTTLDLPKDGKRKSRDVSVTATVKRSRMASTPTNDGGDIKMEDVHDGFSLRSEADNRLENVLSAYHSGMVLDKPLLEYVRDAVISPLTGGMLDVLVQVGREVENLERQDDQEGPAGEYDFDSVIDHVGSLMDGTVGDVDAVFSTSLKAQVKAKRLDRLVGKILQSDYHRLKSLLLELARVKEEVIDLDTLVHSKEEMLEGGQQTQTDDPLLPLRWTSMELDDEKIDTALKQYARILKALSERRELDKRSAGGVPMNDDATTMNKLRLAYIALAKLAPTKELARGQWAAWAEYFQQQMAQQQKQMQART